MTKNKSLFKNISIFLCLIPMFLLSLFCLLPKSNSKKVSAADNVNITYSFTGSNFMTSLGVNGAGNFGRSVYMANMQFSFLIDSNSGLVDLSAFVYLPYIYNSESQGFIDNGSRYDTATVPMDNNYYRYNFLVNYTDSSSYGYVPFWFKINNSSFNANIRKIVFGSSLDHPLSDINIDSNYKYNYVQYFDINNNFITFVISAYETNYSYDIDGNYEDLLFLYRIYYLNDPSNFTDNENYNFGYDAGYNSGYTDGNSDGNSSGYTDGYSAGQSYGYHNGYNDGVEQSGRYSFNSLIGAVIDAPVSAFTSLLNFEILDFNILGFITGLLTLALIIFIIKLCLGGK